MTPVTDAPNKVWAIDFQFDSDETGGKIKIANLVDEHTRECLACPVERRTTTPALTRMLDQVVALRGYQAVIRADSGPEFTSQALATWAQGHAGLMFIPPGTPWNNGYGESLNSRLRDDCLNVNSFRNLRHARAIIAIWRDEYNTTTPLGPRSPDPGRLRRYTRNKTQHRRVSHLMDLLTRSRHHQ